MGSGVSCLPSLPGVQMGTAGAKDHLKNPFSVSLLSCVGAGKQKEKGDIFLTDIFLTTF